MTYKVKVMFYDENGCSLYDIGWFIIFIPKTDNPSASIYDLVESKIAPYYDSDYYTIDFAELSSNEFIEVPQEIYEEL